MARPASGVPVQTVPRILAEGAKEAIEDLHDGDYDVELQHGLAADPMVELPDGDGTEDLAVHEPDEDTLH